MKRENIEVGTSVKGKNQKCHKCTFTHEEEETIIPQLNKAANYREYVVRKKIVPYMWKVFGYESSTANDLGDTQVVLLDLAKIYESTVVLLEAALAEITTLEENEKGILKDERYDYYIHARIRRYGRYPCTSHDLSDLSNSLRHKALLLKRISEAYRGNIPERESYGLVRRDIVAAMQNRSFDGDYFHRLLNLVEMNSSEVLWDVLDQIND